MWIPWRVYERIIVDLHEAKHEALQATARVAAAERAQDLLTQRVASLDAERQREQGHHEDLAEERAQMMGRITEQTARIASLTAHVEWLSHHVNRLEQERGALLARLGVGHVRVPEIALDHDATTPSREPAPPPWPREETIEHAVPDDSIPAGIHQGVSFEDMGDAAAEAAGIRHAEDGTVEYVR